MWALLTILLILTRLTQIASADTWEDGLAAFEREDFGAAYKALRPLAEKGHDGAQSLLGFMHHRGHGVPKDHIEGTRWYRMAAEQGHAMAQVLLGQAYDKGAGVPENDVEAVRWYRMAAEQGYTEGQSHLGFMYYHGHGVPEDAVEAARWLHLAAEQGSAWAQSLLGGMYVLGEGLPEDHVQAYAWLNIAAAQGNTEAQKGKQLIAESMTPKNSPTRRNLRIITGKPTFYPFRSDVMRLTAMPSAFNEGHVDNDNNLRATAVVVIDTPLYRQRRDRRN